MNARRYGRSVTLLVWTLVSIGLFSGAVTNALVGWTLVHLNRDRVEQMEQERRLSQGTARLHRLGQEVRGDIHALLQGRDATHGKAPLSELGRLVGELRAIHPEPVLDDLRWTASDLETLWAKVSDWHQRYTPVAADLEEKRTLTEAREHLERLRAAAETLEGKQRLEDAVLLRRWREASGTAAADLGRTILENQFRNRARVLKEVRTELTELSRLVETLAGEDQLDHLADLKDNQLKPLLERLEYQLHVLAHEEEAPGELNPPAAVRLREILFGEGHAIVQEYQTIRIGEGGLYWLSSEALSLRREREEIERATREIFGRMEAIHPVLAAQAVERGRSLTHHAEESLTRGLRNLMMVSVLFLVGFLGLGGLISQKVRQQVVALSRLQRQKELILDSAGEGILGLDREGRASFINPAGGRLLGWDPQLLLGRAHRDFLRPLASDGDPREDEALEGVLKRGAAFHRHDEVVICRDGSHLPVEYTATPMRNERGVIEGAVITLLDVTARKEAEAALQRSYLELDELNRSLEEKVAERTLELEAKHGELIRAQEELARKEKLAAIGSLAAGVAHEINNPAAIIRGNAEILRRKLPAEASGREEAVEILESTERISRITQNLLIFAREQTLRPEEVEINRLLLEVVAQAPHHVPLGEVKVEQSHDPRLPPFLGDREKLRQVFTNLVINALEAMGGEGILKVSTFLDGGEVGVCIADSGPGIPPDQKARIFHPFYTTKKTGTGLGLSVSYGIVQAMGGSIEVQSEEGKGAVFKVRLPVGEEAGMGC